MVTGRIIPLGVTEKTKRQAGKINPWCSPLMISSFIPYTGRLPHAVRKMHRPIAGQHRPHFLTRLYRHTERPPWSTCLPVHPALPLLGYLFCGRPFPVDG